MGHHFGLHLGRLLHYSQILDDTIKKLAEGISLTPPDIEQKKFYNIDTKLKKVAPLVRAKARASIVLPVPGGPHNRIPLVW